MVAPKQSGEVAAIFHGNWCCWKTSILATGGYRLAPPRQCSKDWEMDFLWDSSWSLAAEVCPVYRLIFSNGKFKKMLSSHSTRNHPLRFSNRYACWLNFCRDHGFHPKVRGANSWVFFTIKWTLDFLIHFSGQSCNSLIFFYFGTSQKLYNSFQSLDCCRFQYFTKVWLNTPKRNA